VAPFRIYVAARCWENAEGEETAWEAAIRERSLLAAPRWSNSEEEQKAKRGRSKNEFFSGIEQA
jgi:hypothetical protein